MPTYRWSELDREREWMLAHAGGRPIADVCADFEREFGTPITKHQVSWFRAQYDMQRRRGSRTAHVRFDRPVGYERESKGYVVVKVRERASKPGSKDNWEFKHRLVWEQANGRKLKPGETVMFADGNTHNFDPGNLVAVDRKLMGALNESKLPYRDRETLEAALAVVRLKCGIVDAVNGKRVCGVCGKEFVPDNRIGPSGYVQKTCRACLDAGLRSPKDFGESVCPRCGKEFKRSSAHQLYCCKRCCYEDYREKRKQR